MRISDWSSDVCSSDLDGRLQYLTVEGDYAKVERGEGVLLLADVKLKGSPLAKSGSASLWDIGDGVVCLEVHSKMNTMDPEVFKIIGKALAIVPKKFKALVVYNEGTRSEERRVGKECVGQVRSRGSQDHAK